jgi:glycosyltransferase involved in cell wall biosynthesis
MTLKHKPIVLVFIDWYWPGYLAGGPVKSLLALVEHLGDEMEFKIVTSNSDIDKKPYAGITTDKWVTSQKCAVYYISDAQLNSTTIEKILLETNYDKIYINSFFSNLFSITPLRLVKKHKIQKPLILAPRGMLGGGALKLKRFKKSVFIKLAKVMGWHKYVIWHATSMQECEEIKNIFPRANPSVISNLSIFESALEKSSRKKSGVLRACFVSRISPKKNLTFALQILKHIDAERLTFSIYGPIEDMAYWEMCQAIIKNLPAHIIVDYKGSYRPSEIASVFKEEDVLFLPTHNENYGHAIVESLSFGCPVIISDQTPWNDLDAHDVGFSIKLSEEKEFINALHNFVALSDEEWQLKSQAAKQYIRQKLSNESIKQQYIKLFT